MIWRHTVSAETTTRRFSERTIRQVSLDCRHSMVRGKFCPDRSELAQLRCIDDRFENDQSFGCQLWYFEGWGVDGSDQRHAVYGVVEYSLQYGLHELVEEAVFDSEAQRERFRHLYEREMHHPTWRRPAQRWLAFGVVIMALISLAYMTIVTLT